MIGDGDSFFTGLDMTRDPAIVKQSFYSVGNHVECEDGTVSSRPGNLCVPWADSWRQSRTYEKRPIEAHGTILDAILFRNPSSGLENTLFATGDGVFLVQPGTTCETISFPTGYLTPTSGFLVQAYNKVYFMSSQALIVWSGNPEDEFLWAGTPDGYASLGSIDAYTGDYYKNRLFIATDANTVWASDILEPLAYSINNEFFVNQGDADSIVRLKGYTNNRMIVFKDNSIYFIDNLTGDLTNAGISLVASEIGLSAERCVSIVGQDVYWLSRRGIMKAILAYDQRLTPDVVPLSESINPVINRINWSSASNSWSAVIGERIYFAVPIDEATVNNCMLVYNLKNAAWESVDAYEDFTEKFEYSDAATYTDNFGPQALVRMEYAGRDVLLGFTHLGACSLYRYNRGKKDIHIEPHASLSVWESTWSAPVDPGDDVLINNPQDTDTEIQTRGYLAGDLSTKRGVHWDFATSTFNPNFTVKIVNGGPNEEYTLKSNITRESSTRLDFANSATATVPDTHSEAYLADYSIDIEGGSEASGQEFYFGDDSTYADVYLPREQEYSERFRTHKRTRAPRLKITNTQGTFRLKSVIATEFNRQKKHRREA